MFPIPFPRFSGHEFWLLRHQAPTFVDGVATYKEPELLRYVGRIQPIRDLKNAKSKFGQDVEAAIDIKTPHNFPILIQTKNSEGDYIFYRDNVWKVEEAIEYDNLIPHYEGTATLVEHPAPDKTAHLPHYIDVQGKVLVNGKYQKIMIGLTDC